MTWLVEELRRRCRLFVFCDPFARVDLLASSSSSSSSGLLLMSTARSKIDSVLLSDIAENVTDCDRILAAAKP